MCTINDGILILYSAYSVKGNQVWKAIRKASLKERIDFLYYFNIYSTVLFCCYGKKNKQNS